jgi:glutaredoxin
MVDVVIYGAPNCRHCENAKKLCENKGLVYEYVDISKDEKARNFIINELNLRQVPQCFINRRHIGGYTELVKEIGLGM